MVDLVKIRKKAKEQKEREAAEAALRQTEDQHRNGEESAGGAPEEPQPEGRLEEFRNAILARSSSRDDSAGAEDSEAVDETSREMLTFRIADEEYAVDIERVVEIVTPTVITRVPNAATNIAGIISLRGTIVTILDVRGKLGHVPGKIDLDTRIVVVRDWGGFAGFVVDRVLRVVKVRLEELDPQPATALEERNEMIQGVFRRSDSLSIVLDIDRLLGVHETS